MRAFAKQHKHHFSAWVILVIVAVVSGYYGYLHNPSQEKQPIQEDVVIESEGIIVRSATEGDDFDRLSPTTQETDKNVYTSLDFLISDSEEDPDQSVAEDTQDDQEDAAEIAQQSEEDVLIQVQPEQTDPNLDLISAKFYVEGKMYTLVYTKGSSVYEFMKELAANDEFTFSGQNYGGQLGFFVNQVNGIQNANNHYWIYYINGEKAKMGISNYILDDGDIITWNYEEAES